MVEHLGEKAVVVMIKPSLDLSSSAAVDICGRLALTKFTSPQSAAAWIFSLDPHTCRRVKQEIHYERPARHGTARP